MDSHGLVTRSASPGGGLLQYVGGRLQGLIGQLQKFFAEGRGAEPFVPGSETIQCSNRLLRVLQKHFVLRDQGPELCDFVQGIRAY